MSHLMGRKGHKTEAYPVRAPTLGVPNEIVRYYFRIDDTTTPGETFSPRPWSPADPDMVQTAPLPSDLNFVLPLPPSTFDRAALVIVTVTGGGAISGDPISVQWRGVLGSNPVIVVPALPFGAAQEFMDPDVVGALAPGTITVLNYDFSDVVVPLGGGTLFPDLAMPGNLVVPSGSSLECFFAVGIDWNASLINEPFGPPTP